MEGEEVEEEEEEEEECYIFPALGHDEITLQGRESHVQAIRQLTESQEVVDEEAYG